MSAPSRMALACAALLCAVALPSRAHAQAYRAAGPADLGGALRLTVDSPSGAVYSGERLRDQFGTQVGVAGELGVRVTPQLLLGGTLGFGLGDPGPRFDAACSGSSRCGAWSARVGLLAHWDFAPWSQVSPWIAYGFGFSAAGASGDEPGARFDYTYAGIDLGRLSAGLDFRTRGPVALGLFAEWTFGVYRGYRWSEQDVTVADGSIRNPTVHQWFSIGPRISF